MAIPKNLRNLALCLLAPLAFLLLSNCTIVKNGASATSAAKNAPLTSDESFDARVYVAANWAGKIVPDIEGRAVDLKEVVAALSKNSDAADKKYGHRQEDAAPFNFVVKCTAAVKTVNVESGAGYLELNLPDATGSASVRVQVGPVFIGSAVRDSLSFIKFGDFVNQIDFANFSREINFYVRDHVSPGIRTSDITGKKLSLVGAFTEDSNGAVVITPVEIRLEK
jgi:predicted lipoprotein